MTIDRIGNEHWDFIDARGEQTTLPPTDAKGPSVRAAFGSTNRPDQASLPLVARWRVNDPAAWPKFDATSNARATPMGTTDFMCMG